MVKEVVQSLGSDERSGLTDAEAEARLKRHGKNVLVPKRRIRTLGLLAFIKEPMVWLLVVAGAVYYWLGDTAETIITLIAVVPIALVDVAIELQTDKALEKLKTLGEPEVTVVRRGVEKRIKSEDLVPGDIALIQEGDVVMADSAMLSGSGVQTDESSLTGESQPVEKQPADRFDESFFANKGVLFAGTTVVSGRARTIVVKTGANTQYGKIGKILAGTYAGKTPLQVEIGKIIKVFAVVAVVLSVSLVVIGLVAYGPITEAVWNEAIIGGVSLAIAAIPEEFPVVFTLFLSLGMLRLANANALVKKLSAVEALGSVDVICTDKTGTITTGKMSVSEVCARPGVSKDDLELAALLACERDPFDPMEKAIYAHAKDSPALAKVRTMDFVHGYPFDTDEKYMSHVWKGSGTVLAAKGSLEGILARCAMDPAEREGVLRQNDEMAERGIRVLAFARKRIDEVRGREEDEKGLEFLGLMGFSDPIRQGVTKAVADCRKAGIRVVMLTGDHKTTARAIADKAGIETDGVVTGKELDVPEKEFLEILEANHVFARVLPEQKLRIVEGYQKLGCRVAVTGDGINDAPALKKANIGVAMGERGTEVAKETAALVLLDDNFKTIVGAVRNGRRIYDNLKKAFSYLVAFHVPIFLSALLIPLMHLPLLLLPVHIVFLELVLHPAISVVYEKEPEERDIMSRRPREAKTRLLHPGEFAGLIIVGTVLFLGTFGVYLAALPWGETYARSVAFSAMVFGQVLLIVSTLARRHTSWKRLVSNKFLLPMMAIALGGYALLMYIPVAADYMRIIPLGPAEWLWIVGMGFVPFMASEILKRTPLYTVEPEENAAG
jgi:Ca2+-transporting ATPase